MRADSLVTIETEGLVGGTYLLVRPGSTRTPQASASATIPSSEPADLSELLTRGTGLLSDAHAMLKEVGGKLGGTLDTVTSAISNVNDIAIGLKQGRGAAGMLLRDQELANQLRQTTSRRESSEPKSAGVQVEYEMRVIVVLVLVERFKSARPHQSEKWSHVVVTNW